MAFKNSFPARSVRGVVFSGRELRPIRAGLQRSSYRRKHRLLSVAGYAIDIGPLCPDGISVEVFTGAINPTRRKAGSNEGGSAP